MSVLLPPDSPSPGHDVVIGRWTNSQQAGGDDHCGARGDCDWTCGKYRGNSVEQFVLGCLSYTQRNIFMPVLRYSIVNKVAYAYAVRDRRRFQSKIANFPHPRVNSVFATKNRTEHVNRPYTMDGTRLLVTDRRQIGQEWGVQCYVVYMKNIHPGTNYPTEFPLYFSHVQSQSPRAPQWPSPPACCELVRLPITTSLLLPPDSATRPCPPTVTLFLRCAVFPTKMS